MHISNSDYKTNKKQQTSCIKYISHTHISCINYALH